MVTGKFFPIPGENMAEFLEIHQIFPVLIHNKSTRPVGFIIADKIIDRINMVEFSNKTRQFNPVIIFQSKVCNWADNRAMRFSLS